MELPCVYVDPHKSRANRTYMDLLHGRSFIILSLFDFHKKRCFGINVDRNVQSWWQKKSKGLASCQMPEISRNDWLARSLGECHHLPGIHREKMMRDAMQISQEIWRTNRTKIRSYWVILKYSIINHFWTITHSIRSWLHQISWKIRDLPARPPKMDSGSVFVVWQPCITLWLPALVVTGSKSGTSTKGFGVWQ